MSYKPWKALERRTAKHLGGIRLWRPDYSDSAPDGESERDTWDCKALSRQAVVRLYQECEAKYREFTGSRHFILVLFDPTRKAVGDLVVCKRERYVELEEKERLLDGFVTEFTECTSA